MQKNSLLLVLMLGACLCAHSQTLHQCSGRGGTTAYRSGACLAGERLVAVRDMAVEIAPDPAPPEATAAITGRGKSARATKPRQAGRRYARRTSSHRGSKRKSTVDPCTREKRARDDFQRRRGIKVTMAELSRWNHRVYDACN